MNTRTFVAGIIFIFACFTGSSNALDVGRIEKEILEKTNVQRQKAGVSPLQSSPALKSLAKDHTKNMCNTATLKHESRKFTSNIKTLELRMLRVKVKSMAENIAFRTWEGDEKKWTDHIIKGWMDSPGHRKNILNPQYRYLGVGVVPCSDLLYSTQVFSAEPGKMP